MATAGLASGSQYERADGAIEIQTNRTLREFRTVWATMLANVIWEQALMQHTPALLAGIDMQQRCVVMSAQFAKLFAAQQATATPLSLRAVIGEACYEDLQPALDLVLSGQMSSQEAWWQLPTGESAYLTTTLVPHMVEGAVVGAVFSGFDLTRVKQTQDELRLIKEAADAASLAKTQFLANISHEIRTPLGTILGFSELLVDESLGVGERAACVSAIQRNGELLSNIINDVLDLAKIEAGKMELSLVPSPLADIVASLDSLIQLRASEKGLRLRVRQEGELPAVIRTDPSRLRQILLNIAGNAVKFTAAGEVEIVIKIEETADRGKKLAFVVADTGPGISATQAERLFAPFSQADASTTRRFGGSGLGLALSKHLAKALGGDVELTRSVEGQGSVFTVTIDLAEEQAPAPAVLQTPDSTTVDLAGTRVLLAEDFADNQALIVRYLRTAGADVAVANNGCEALAKVKEQAFDVVLMDLQMPAMDGYEATAELRRLGYKGPIIALTAHAMKDEQQRCLASGFDDHIGKPFKRSALLRRIAKHRARASSPTHQ